MKRALLIVALLAGVAHADEPPPSYQLQTRMDDGSAVKMAPIPVPQSTDHRPWIFAGGAVLVAIALFMNHRTRQRDRFDRDAEDLHAAAKDEPHE
ncbi:MAG TPA: hypothetical protein VGM88_26880 [Kofleriaceae bacterium]